MNKPNNFENTKAGGDFTSVECGGHICKILKVEETKSKTGKDMLVVYFDFAKGDKQEGYFKESYDKDIRPEKKWPYAGTKYIVTTNNDGQCSRDFKAFITCFEASNGYTLKDNDWGEKFCSLFKDKIIGAVYGLAENEYNGEVKTRPELRWFCDVSKVSEAKVPELKKLKEVKTAVATPVPGFVPIKDEECPF